MARLGIGKILELFVTVLLTDNDTLFSSPTEILRLVLHASIFFHGLVPN